MERLTRVTFVAVLVLASSAAIADSGGQGTPSGRGHDGARVDGGSARFSAEAFYSSLQSRPLGATGSAFPDDSSSGQDTTNLDPLLGAPGDYGDRYSSSTSSELENRSNGMDNGTSWSAPSRSTSSTSARKSPATKAMLTHNLPARQAGNSSAPALGVGVYRSPW